MKLAMPNIHQKLFSEKNWIRTIQAAAYAAFIALILAVILLIVILGQKTPAPVDTTNAFNRANRVTFVAQNFTRLWLTGTIEDKDAMKTMLADDTMLPASWGTEPVQVSEVNTANLDSAIGTDGNATQWVATIAATISTPGNDSATRNYFTVTLMDAPGTNVRAVTLPRLVNNIRPEVTVTSSFTNSVPLNSPLGTAVSNFAGAFYTDQNGSLNRFTSREFKLQPIKGSPYTGTELISVKATSPYNRAAAEGTTLDVLAQIKASISLSTFQTLSVPMRVKAIENGQWVIDDISEYTPIKTFQVN